jgi:hypothetical protein
MVEQCRIIGMGAERELWLLSEIERLDRENKRLKAEILPKAEVERLFSEQMANKIERISQEIYGVVLVEHKEAADWLRLKAKRRAQESKQIDTLK